MIPDALRYPLRNDGWIVIVIGAVFSVLLNLLQHAPLVGLGVGIFASGYFIAFSFDIIGSTMTGNDNVPDWPAFSGLITPFCQFLGLIVLSFWPMAVGAFFVRTDNPWSLIPALVALGWGCLYFPMATLAMQAYGSVLAAMPLRVVPAIFRAMPGYAIAVISLVTAFAMVILVQQAASRVPYAGWLIGAAVGLYGLMFQGRLIGLVYRAKHHKLGWV